MMHIVEQRIGMKIGFRVLHEARVRNSVRIDDDFRPAMLHRLQRFRTRADDHVAREQQIGLLRIDTHLI